MFLVGLTGGIAAGKSAVADLWSTLGAEVIDADVLARKVVEPGSDALEDIVQYFGLGVVQPSGELDRAKLAGLVFQDPEKRLVLESFTHPRIKKLAESLISSSQSPIVVYVIPLLVESGSQLPFDFVVTVEAPEKDQVERMVLTRGMSEKAAVERIRSQATPAERANAADRILNSNQSLVLLLKDAKSLWSEIVSLAESKAHHEQD
jgi:dephospho-CoA kinase